MKILTIIFGAPCLTLRPETEWVETVAAGWNTIVGTDKDQIIHATQQQKPSDSPGPIFGKGDAAQKIVEIITPQIERFKL